MIVALQRPQLQQRAYAQALQGILKGTADAALAKQGARVGGQPSSPTDDRPFGQPAVGGDSKPAFKMPKIPIWPIVLVVCVVVPLILCCCCIYCCCCRNKAAAERRQVPTDDPSVAPGGPSPSAGGGIGGWGERARGFLGGAGGGMAANAISSFFNRRRGGGGGSGGVPMAGGGGLPLDPTTAGNVEDRTRGGYVPPQPGQAEEGKGLYPAVPVADKGAGGSW